MNFEQPQQPKKEEEKLTPEEIIGLGAKNEPGSVELELLRKAADERERKEREGK